MEGSFGSKPRLIFPFAHNVSEEFEKALDGSVGEQSSVMKPYHVVCVWTFVVICECGCVGVCVC